MRQSSGAEGTDKRPRAPRRAGSRTVAARLGIAGAAVVVTSLWFQRQAIVDATTGQLLAFGGLALGLAGVLAAVLLISAVAPAASENADDLVDVLHAAAQGDLTREPVVDTLGGESRVALVARTALRAFRGTVNDTRAGAQEVVSRSQDLARQYAAALSVAQRGSENAASIARQGETLVSLTRAAHEDVTRLTGNTAALVEEAREQRSRGARLRELTSQSVVGLQSGRLALDALSADADGSAAELDALAGASEEIRSFVTLVRKMARQSKLLALNAAMEAARAGEQGSGFAVVASEVRRLAKSSSEAADRTDRLVTEVLERIERVRVAGARAAETSRQAQAAAVAGLAVLGDLEREAAQAAEQATTEQDGLTGVTAAGEALVVRLEQLVREAESLSAGLRESTSTTSNQQSRLQDLSVATSSLTRATTKVASLLSGIRTERPAAAPEETEASPPPPLLAAV